MKLSGFNGETGSGGVSGESWLTGAEGERINAESLRQKDREQCLDKI